MNTTLNDDEQVNIALAMMIGHHNKRNHPDFYSDAIMFGPEWNMHIRFGRSGYKKEGFIAQSVSEDDLRSHYSELPERNDLSNVLLLSAGDAADAGDGTASSIFVLLNKLAPEKHFGLVSLFSPASFEALRDGIERMGRGK